MSYTPHGKFKTKDGHAARTGDKRASLSTSQNSRNSSGTVSSLVDDLVQRYEAVSQAETERTVRLKTKRTTAAPAASTAVPFPSQSSQSSQHTALQQRGASAASPSSSYPLRPDRKQSQDKKGPDAPPRRRLSLDSDDEMGIFEDSEDGEDVAWSDNDRKGGGATIRTNFGLSRETAASRKKQAKFDPTRVTIEEAVPENVMNMWGDKIKAKKPGDPTMMSYRQRMNQVDKVKERIERAKLAKRGQLSNSGNGGLQKGGAEEDDAAALFFGGGNESAAASNGNGGDEAAAALFIRGGVGVDSKNDTHTQQKVALRKSQFDFEDKLNSPKKPKMMKHDDPMKSPAAASGSNPTRALKGIEFEVPSSETAFQLKLQSMDVTSETNKTKSSPSGTGSTFSGSSSSGSSSDSSDSSDTTPPKKKIFTGPVHKHGPSSKDQRQPETHQSGDSNRRNIELKLTDSELQARGREKELEKKLLDMKTVQQATISKPPKKPSARSSSSSSGSSSDDSSSASGKESKLPKSDTPIGKSSESDATIILSSSARKEILSDDREKTTTSVAMALSPKKESMSAPSLPSKEERENITLKGLDAKGDIDALPRKKNRGKNSGDSSSSSKSSSGNSKSSTSSSSGSSSSGTDSSSASSPDMKKKKAQLDTTDPAMTKPIVLASHSPIKNSKMGKDETRATLKSKKDHVEVPASLTENDKEAVFFSTAQDEETNMKVDSIEGNTSTFTPEIEKDDGRQRLTPSQAKSKESVVPALEPVDKEEQQRIESLHKQMIELGLPTTLAFDEDALTRISRFSESGDSYLQDLKQQKVDRDDERREELMEDALDLYRAAVAEGAPETEALFLQILDELKVEKESEYREKDKRHDELIEKAIMLHHLRKKQQEKEDIKARAEQKKTERRMLISESVDIVIEGKINAEPAVEFDDADDLVFNEDNLNNEEEEIEFETDSEGGEGSSVQRGGDENESKAFDELPDFPDAAPVGKFSSQSIFIEMKAPSPPEPEWTKDTRKIKKADKSRVKPVPPGSSPRRKSSSIPRPIPETVSIPSFDDSFFQNYEDEEDIENQRRAYEERLAQDKAAAEFSEKEAELFQKEARHTRRMVCATGAICAVTFLLLMIFVLDPLRRRDDGNPFSDKVSNLGGAGSGIATCDIADGALAICF